MGSISSALLNSSSALGVFGQAFNVIENNITNANTPGYADQNLSLEPLPFDPSQQLPGGVEAGPLLSSRDEYLDQAVRSQQQSLGYAQQRASDLGQVQTQFSLTSSSGIDTALNAFFNSFSQLSVNPNDGTSRQGVLTAAANVTQSFQAAANSLNQASSNVASQTQGVVSRINDLAAQIAHINQTFQSNSAAESDAGLDAQMHQDLENLAQLTNFTVLRGSSGAYNIAIGGETPLVLGSEVNPISAGTVSNQTTLLNSQGVDISSQITQGQLGALVEEQNTTIPGYLASLNTLAQNFADAVNGQLSQGIDQNGNTPETPLFSYDQPGNAASSIVVNNLTADQLAAAAAGAPGGNGNAIAVVQLATSPQVNGFTFTQFYGNLGAQVGNDVASAQQDQQQAQAQLTQAQTQRAQVSGVDLNQEASKLLQFQQAYQAVGKLVSVLDSLTTTLLNMVPNP